MRTRSPYNFRLSLRVMNSFSHEPGRTADQMRFGARIGEKPVVMTICSKRAHARELDLSASAPVPEADLEALARWVLFDELDLRPFYRIAEPHPVLGPIIHVLRGVKPVRPASLLEMAVIVITEQQISLAAAYKIRTRLLERYGDPVYGVWVFPDAGVLARASLEEFRACGYSQRKAEYIHDFASRVAEGFLDLEGMKTLSDDKVFESLLGIRGWGPWSANYFLIRGLARPDQIPADDLAVRTVVGNYLGHGSRANPREVAELVEPFRPYRGITAFYLLAYGRMGK